MAGVLLVGDEEASTCLLKAALERFDYSVREARIEAVAHGQAARPELVLLDLGSSDVDGARVVRELRSWSEAPIVVLSAHSGQGEVIELLDAGADDYLSKPFRTGELLARIKATLRGRPAARTQPLVSCGDLMLDFELRMASVRGMVVHLTPLEYSIISILARRRGETIRSGFILRELWSGSDPARARRLRVTMTRLRRKIERDPSHPELVVTVPRVGYRLAG